MTRRPQQRRPAPSPRPLPEPKPEDEAYDDEFEDDGTPNYTDADAFFAAEINPVEGAVLTLYGQTYTLPTVVPLAFTLLAERHRDDESIETLRTVLGPVFGPDALDQWLAAGISLRQLSIVLLWSAQNMHQPGSMSFPDAAREYDRREAQGKALNRAQRRASGSRR